MRVTCCKMLCCLPITFCLVHTVNRFDLWISKQYRRPAFQTMYVQFCNEAKSCAYWLVNEILWYETETRPRRLETTSRDRDVETETTSLVTGRSLDDNMLGFNRHLVSGHEISRLQCNLLISWPLTRWRFDWTQAYYRALQHGLQLIMARYTRIFNCRPCCKTCNLYINLNRPNAIESIMYDCHGGGGPRRDMRKNVVCTRYR